MNDYNTNVFINERDGFKSFLTKVFGIMAVGLLVSIIVVLLMDNGLAFLLAYFMGNTGFTVFVFVSLILELIVAIVFRRKLFTMSKGKAWFCYILYSVLTGLSLSIVVLQYTFSSVAFAFGAALVLFVCMAIIGKTTNIDLSRFGSLLGVGLISMLIISLLNLFLFKSARINYILAVVGVVLFLIIIAYDMQNLKAIYQRGQASIELNEKLAIYGAFQLYLDFINLFLRILEIFGKRRD